MVNTIFHCYFSMRSCIRSNCSHLFPRQLMTRMQLSIAFVVTTLLCHVPHIIIMRSKKKMLRVDTRPYVAFVTNTHSIWNFSALLCPYNTSHWPMLPSKSLSWIAFFIQSVRCANVATIRILNPFNWLGVPSGSHNFLQYVKTLFARRAAKIGVQLSHMVDRVCIQLEFAAL